MILNNKITETFIDSPWLYDNTEESLEYYHIGSKSLQDLSEKYTYQMWYMYYEDNIIKLKGLITNEIIEIKEVEGVKELSFAFNINMDLVYIYRVDNRSYLTFYDTLANVYKTEIFSNISSTRIIFDDNRLTQSNTSDVCLFYINNQTDTLCCRVQRDRYLKEYVLKEVPKSTRLLRVGMTEAFRLKFKIQTFN